MPGEIAVQGLRELTRTFAHAPKDVRREYKRELRTVAEPVASTAERLAVTRIAKVGPKWSKMRIGVTQTLVYVVPRQRGRRYPADPMKRPKFGTLLGVRAMQPALEQNQHRIEHDFEQMLDRLVRKWDHDGP